MADCDHHPIDINIEYDHDGINLYATCDFCGASMSACVGENDWNIEEAQLPPMRVPRNVQVTCAHCFREMWTGEDNEDTPIYADCRKLGRGG